MTNSAPSSNNGKIVPSGFGRHLVVVIHALCFICFWIRSLKLTRRWFFPSGFLGDLLRCFTTGRRGATRPGQKRRGARKPKGLAEHRKILVSSPCFWIMILCPGFCLTRIAKRSQGRQTKQLMKWDQEKLFSKSSLEVTLHSKHHEGICLRQQWQEQTSFPWCNFNKPSLDKMKTCIQTKSEAHLSAPRWRQ